LDALESKYNLGGADMNNKLSSFTVLVVLVIAIFMGVDFGIEVVENSSGRVITVGYMKDYYKIQHGIDAAKDGDTVIVYDEPFYETIIVNKSINLIGVNAEIWGSFPGFLFYIDHAAIEILSDNNNIFGNEMLETSGGSVNIHGNNNKVQGNDMTDGVRLYNSENNTIIDNDITVLDRRDSIFLENSNWNTIKRNNVEINLNGIHLSHSNNNDIIGNEFIKGPYSQFHSPKGGIHFETSGWNRIIGNKIQDNDFGVRLESSVTNIIHHNNFINNIDQAYDDMHDNFWDDGYPSGGNYWSDYTGVDLFSGPLQNIPGGDGIGDTNYTIDADSVDNYPLMEPHSGPVADAGPAQTVVVNEIVQFYGNKSCSPDGDIVSYEWDFGDGSANGSGMSTTHIYSTTGIYNVSITVTDSKGKKDNDICTITVVSPSPPAPPKPEILLKQGMNLISIPSVQSSTVIEDVLQPIAGLYDSVIWYDKSDINDPWKHFKVGKSFGNDLIHLNETMGFWIDITQPGYTIFIYNDTRPTSNQTIELKKEWNLVGYPSLTNHNRTTGLNNLIFNSDIDAIQWFDSSAKTWHYLEKGDSFEVGRGYWIHAKTDCVWEVPL
jgi:parallel beta-helix repeat protein